jgi:hypothetical protein
MASPTTQPKTQNQPAATTKPSQNPATNAQLRPLIEKLAYELWEKKGRKNGQDVENWVEAEKIIRQKLGV